MRFYGPTLCVSTVDAETGAAELDAGSLAAGLRQGLQTRARTIAHRDSGARGGGEGRGLIRAARRLEAWLRLVLGTVSLQLAFRPRGV
jgi:hypothetical protein